MWPTNNQRAEQKEEEKEAGQPVVLMTSNCCTWEDSSLYTSSYMLDMLEIIMQKKVQGVIYNSWCLMHWLCLGKYWLNWLKFIV